MALFCPFVYSKGFSDKSSLNITDFLICTSAAMKSGQGIDVFKKWSKPLQARYAVIYPNKSSKEIDSYSAERIVDKRKELNRMGIFTTPEFLRFYNQNCAPYAP